MSRRKRKRRAKQGRPKQETSTKKRANLTSYRDALASVAKARMLNFVTPVTINNPPYPDLPLSPATQVKLHTAMMLMALVGRGPEDHFVDQSIEFRRIQPKVLDWLERNDFLVRRNFAPLGMDYTRMFAGGIGLPEPEANEHFYSHLIHMLVLEAQLALAKQYYEGTGLAHAPPPTDMLWEFIAAEHGVDVDKVVEQSRLANLNHVSLIEFHGRIFLEYFIYSVRAQWDKLVRLGDIAFGLSPSWNSFNKGLHSLVRQPLSSRFAKDHMDILNHIATEQLVEESWLRNIRDSLTHKTGRHSAGVVPQKKSLETTYELWLRIQDEHNWFREAFVALLIVLVTHQSNDQER